MDTTEFNSLTLPDLEEKKFVLDSDWNVAVRIVSEWEVWWGDMYKSENLLWLEDYAEARTNLWLEIGVDVEPAKWTDDNYVTDNEIIILNSLIVPSKTLYVDVNREDTYTENWTQVYPFKTINWAIAQIITNNDDSVNPYNIEIANWKYYETITLESLNLHRITLTWNWVVQIRPTTNQSFKSLTLNTNISQLHIKNITFLAPFQITWSNGSTAFNDVIFENCSFVYWDWTQVWNITLTCINNVTFKNIYYDIDMITYNNVNYSVIDWNSNIGSMFTINQDSTANIPSQWANWVHLINNSLLMWGLIFTKWGTSTINFISNNATLLAWYSWWGVTVPVWVSITAYSTFLRWTWTNNGTIILRGSFIQTYTAWTWTLTKTQQPLSQMDNDSWFITSWDITWKEDVSNKSIDINEDWTSDIKYPSVKAVKDYTDWLDFMAKTIYDPNNKNINSFDSANIDYEEQIVLWYNQIENHIDFFSISSDYYKQITFNNWIENTIDIEWTTFLNFTIYYKDWDNYINIYNHPDIEILSVGVWFVFEENQVAFTYRLNTWWFLQEYFEWDILQMISVKEWLDLSAPKWSITTSWLTQTTWKLLWRNTAEAWAVEEITLWTWLSFDWTTLNAEWWGWGWAPTEIRIRIPWEMVADTSNYQWVFWKNNTWWTITITNVSFQVALVASWSGAACAFNIYKSSWTASDWINTSAVNLFTSAIDLGTTYESLTNVPNTATVESWRWISLRCTSSAWATTKASDCEVIITY